MSFVFQPDIALEIVDALFAVEAREPARQFVYTVATQSNAPGVGTADQRGVLRAHAADSVTIGTDAGDVEIGWYEITAISVAPDYS